MAPDQPHCYICPLRGHEWCMRANCPAVVAGTDQNPLLELILLSLLYVSKALFHSVLECLTVLCFPWWLQYQDAVGILVVDTVMILLSSMKLECSPGIGFCLTSMIHLTVFFNKMWGLLILFLFVCLWMSSGSSTICWKMYPSSIETFWQFCQKSVGHIWVGLFFGSLFSSVDLCVCPSANTTQSWLQ